MINLTKKLPIIAEACSKPSGEERLVPRSHSRMPTATKVITPETRWRMDAIAVTGNRMVCRSRLTGLCFFTFLIMNNAHMLFLLFPGTTGTEVNFLLPGDVGISFLRSACGSDSVLSITARHAKHCFQMRKRHVTTLGGSGLQGVPRPGGSIGCSQNHYN